MRCEGTPGRLVAGKLVTCELCRGFGRIGIEGCPRAAVTEDVWEAVDMHSILTRHHTWPVAGGAVDQSASFLSAVAALDSDIEIFKRYLAQRAGAR